MAVIENNVREQARLPRRADLRRVFVVFSFCHQQSKYLVEEVCECKSSIIANNEAIICKN